MVWLAWQENVKQGYREMQEMHREALTDMLASAAEKILLDPASLECQIHYRIGMEGRMLFLR